MLANEDWPANVQVRRTRVARAEFRIAFDLDKLQGKVARLRHGDGRADRRISDARADRQPEIVFHASADLLRALPFHPQRLGRPLAIGAANAGYAPFCGGVGGRTCNSATPFAGGGALDLWWFRREPLIHSTNGMGGSKLKIPATKPGTARNMNTIAALADMASRP